MIKRLFFPLLLVFTALTSVWADDVEFRASAPGQVIVGKPFQLSYTINQRAKDLRAPEFTNFDCLAGPYQSQSSSTSFIDGKRTSSYTLTFTYTLMAQQEGSFSLQPATIVVGSETYSSNGLRIKVLPPDEQPAPTTQTTKTTQTTTSSSNIFMRTIVTKTRVHEQEAICLSYKLYFAGVDVTQFTNNTKIPEFKGFLKQDLEQGEIQTELEHYDGRNYQTAVVYRTLLFPQQSGDITIDPASFEAVLRVQNRSQVRSIFDDFFDSYTNVTKPLTAPGVTIHVESLPKGKPTGFSGGVGQFTMTSSISATDLKANEAVTLKLVIKGSGNMKLIKTPLIDWPEGLEVYDPKVDNNFKATASGMSGTKTIEYLAIPRAGGDYVIPAIQFSYFDTQSNTYRTLSSEEYTLHIARNSAEGQPTVAASSYQQVNKESIKQLGTDIRYIHTDELSAPKTSSSTWLQIGSTSMILAYFLPLFIAAVLFIVYRKQIRENADSTKVRYRKANKVAQKRLKTAAKLMEANQKEAFYEEIERAAWTYLSDRLSIPTAELNKENMAQILSNKQVSDELIHQVKEVLTRAEFARYAPALGHSMDELFQQTTALIDQLESCKL